MDKRQVSQLSRMKRRQVEDLSQRPTWELLRRLQVAENLQADLRRLGLAVYGVGYAEPLQASFEELGHQMDEIKLELARREAAKATEVS